MLIIEGKTIKFSRGDDISFDFMCKDENGDQYIFDVNDEIEFRIFEKNGYGKQAILSKEITIDEETSVVTINLTSSETKIGKETNTAIIYWYEISINEDNTVIGFDDTGPALLYLLPAREES